MVASRRLWGCLALLVMGLSAACSGPVETEDDASELTLDDGAKFIVSASQEKVVIRKKVGGDAFPFTGDELRGKALLIHPIEGKSEGGAFTWAKQVVETENELVVTGDPLDYDDLLALNQDPRADDRIVRVYLDPKRKPLDSAPSQQGQSATQAAAPAGNLMAGALRPAEFPALDLGVKPQGWSGVLTGDSPNVWVWSEITKNTNAFASVSNIRSGGFKSSFNVMHQMQRDGLEFGIQSTVEYKVSFDLYAIAGGRGTVFETKQVPLLERSGFILIAGFPVPAMLRVYAYTGCYAVAGFKFQGTITTGLRVDFGASVRFKAGEGAPESWVQPGSVPNHLDVTPIVEGAGAAPSAGFVCHVGRVNIDLEIGRICKGPMETCGAMVIAPYFGIVPQVFVTDGALIGQDSGLKLFSAASLRFGAFGRMFGKGVSAEFDLIRWAPDLNPPEAR